MSPYEPREEDRFYSEQTSAGRYADYDRGQGPPPRQPWYRNAPVLLGIGALTVIVLAALVFAVMKFASPSTKPTAVTSTPSSSTTATSSAAPTSTHHSNGGGSGGGQTVLTEAPQTVTETDTPAPTDTDTPVTTVPTDTPTTTIPTETDTSTVTQTVTTNPYRPNNGNNNGGNGNFGGGNNNNSGGHNNGH